MKIIIIMIIKNLKICFLPSVTDSVWSRGKRSLPYGLITTAVSADLGTHETVRDSAKALGMMTAIIDGMGRAVLVSVPGFVQI